MRGVGGTRQYVAPARDPPIVASAVDVNDRYPVPAKIEPYGGEDVCGTESS